MSLVAGIDIGTSSTKIVVIDERGSVHATKSISYGMDSPNPGWFEQNPHAWVAAAEKCLLEVDALDIHSIGVTGQMHGLVPLDEKGDVLRPALLWNDQRTVLECTEWESAIGPKAMRGALFNAPMTGFQLPKILWMKRNEPDLFRRIRSCLLPKDYVAYSLTGYKGSDCADASGTGVFDVGQLQWNTNAMERLGLEPDWFPAIVQNEVGRDQKGRPWFLAGGDQSANGIGCGCSVPGRRSLSLGSSAVLFSSAKEPKFHPSETLNCFGHASGGWLCMGVSLNGTLAIEAFLREWMPGVEPKDLNQLASESRIGANDVRVYPYFGGERCPINDPRLQARVEGVGPNTQMSDLARGLLEGISFNLTKIHRYIDDVAGPGTEYVASGGGSKNDIWLEILASAFGEEVGRMANPEGPAIGAAIYAGVQVGIWPDFESTLHFAGRVSKSFRPTMDLDAAFNDWLSRA